MIKVTQTGNFSQTIKFLERAKNLLNSGVFDKYGKMGVDVLSEATPVKTGKTASSWTYDVELKSNRVTISWSNSNYNENVQIAILLQYGHGTGGGGYVTGIDYINPAMKPVFDSIANSLWGEVTR